MTPPTTPVPQRRGLKQYREVFLIALPALLLVFAAFWVTSKFIAPPPPKKIVIAAASPQSPYFAAAKRYAEHLKQIGVELEVRETSGSVNNLALLKDPASGVDAAFVQGGLGNAGDSGQLYSLGRVFYEPVWIFHRGDAPITRLTELKGKRILVGPAGGGTEHVALRLLNASGITKETATLINSELPPYVEAFAAGTADAGFLLLGPQAQTIKRLFASPHARLMNLVQADAYVQRFPFLSRIDLKEGVVDFANIVPSTDTQMLSTTAAVVIRRDLHSALANLLTQSIIAVHSQPRLDATGETGLLNRAGTFPVGEDQEYPMSPDALRVYKSGPPFLQRYLPFWMATLADRLIYFLLPAIGILLPTLRFAPAVYNWRMRRRIIYWYRELKRVEARAKETPTAVAAGLQEIDRIDEAANRIAVPIAFANQLYDLRQHIDVVRRKLQAVPTGLEQA